MAVGKLYWRVKKNDKWTWKPVNIEGSEFWDHLQSLGLTLWDIEVERFNEEEEEELPCCWRKCESEGSKCLMEEE